MRVKVLHSRLPTLDFAFFFRDYYILRQRIKLAVPSVPMGTLAHPVPKETDQLLYYILSVPISIRCSIWHLNRYLLST